MFWEIMNSHSATEKEEVLPRSHFEKGTILADAIHPPKMPPLLPHTPPPSCKVESYPLQERPSPSDVLR